MHPGLWIIMAAICLFMAAVAFVSALAVEGVVTTETYFLTADLLVCAAAIYCGISGGPFTSLIPKIGFIVSLLTATFHVLVTWLRGLFKFFTGNRSVEPDPLHALFVRVTRPLGIEGKVDPAEVEVCRRVLEYVRERWEG